MALRSDSADSAGFLPSSMCSQGSLATSRLFHLYRGLSGFCGAAQGGKQGKARCLQQCVAVEQALAPDAGTPLAGKGAEPPSRPSLRAAHPLAHARVVARPAVGVNDAQSKQGLRGAQRSAALHDASALT